MNEMQADPVFLLIKFSRHASDALFTAAEREADEAKVCVCDAEWRHYFNFSFKIITANDEHDNEHDDEEDEVMESESILGISNTTYSMINI